MNAIKHRRTLDSRGDERMDNQYGFAYNIHSFSGLWLQEEAQERPPAIVVEQLMECGEILIEGRSPI
ncbi:hypothetical protein ACROYT_G027795 [Oculina patagonica]